MISRPSAGKLFDTKGENAIIYPGILINAIWLLLFALSASFMMLAAAVLIGLGLGAIQSGTQTLVVKITPSHHLAPDNSTFYLCTDLGNCIGPLLTGALITFLGYRGMYIIVAVIGFLTLLIYWFAYTRKASRAL
ncbi:MULTISPECIES: MFS transporter [Clostridium]|jgi:MFS family permease|uniref:MFS transporter n=1 Tax=Clostridium TaxID=1485 RepID=UPI0009EF607C